MKSEDAEVMEYQVFKYGLPGSSLSLSDLISMIR